MIDITKLQEAIDKFTLTQPAEDYRVVIPADKGPRKYLGMSMLGSDCLRAVFYEFRHTFTKKFPARLYRLFRRGHREEYVFITLLRGAGLTVYDLDENGEQFEVKDFSGHLSGHCDGFLIDETGELLTKATRAEWTGKPILAEYKSYNLKRFKELKKKGVAVSDPKYYAQLQLYMGYFKVRAALFCAVCKDDDHLEFQWIKFSKKAFMLFHGKADQVINSNELPPKIGSSVASWKCKYCDAKEVCHKGAPAIKSCRSCVYASPAEDAQWECAKGREFGTVCKSYKDITK